MISGKWVLCEQPDEEIFRLCEELRIQPLTARLLWNRGYRSVPCALRFLKKEEGQFHDPYLLKDMDLAAQRTKRAIEKKEKIKIYGDYDVDGVTASAILCQYLRNRGADADVYIPDRLDEGYGLSGEAIRRIAADGTNLIITVDTGVTAVEEAKLIRSLGMDLVVTDHHECRPELPDCAAVVNPRRPDCPYPYKELAGVGVVFKLICAVDMADVTDTEEKRKRLAALCRSYIEYTAVGTIADVMPLTDENRLIVNLGLAYMQDSDKTGLCALMDAATASPDPKSKYPQKKRKITSSFISFTVAPRVNAAGRIAKATRAVELFMTDSRETADIIAKELCDINRERQETENEIALEAFRQIEEEHDLENECVLVLAGEHWHHGVIGIVASRITEKYHIPTILISFEGEGDTGKGSGRSVEGFDLVKGLTACEDLLVKFGGHALAAGLTVAREHLPAFRKRLNELAREAFGGKIPPPEVSIDCAVRFENISLASAEEFFLLEPYGTANPIPLFALSGARIVTVTALSGGKHTKLTVCDPDDPEIQRTAMLFGTRTESFAYRSGDLVDLAFQMDINDFAGSRTVQMIVQDIRPHGESSTYLLKEQAILAAAMRGDALPSSPVPSRGEFAAVWMELKESGNAVDCITLANRTAVAYHKIRIILMVFEETGLLCVRSRNGEGLSIRLTLSEEKKDLLSAPTMRKLSERYGESIPEKKECQKQ